MDMNDRQLRNVIDGLGGRTNGTPREDGYDITVASEIMAVLCLANDITDLKARLARLVIGYTYGKPSEQQPVTAGDLHAEGAMCALLKDALKPNLVQTLEHVPAVVHGGPFANIAHGCNSVTATRMAMKLGDYCCLLYTSGKLSSTSVAKFIAEQVEDKIKSRKLIIPGKVAVLKGDIEAKLPGWEVIVAPLEAVQLVKFLKDMQANGQL